MTGLRLFGLAVILVVASIGWVVLGGSVEFRTNDMGASGSNDVGALWGSAQTQTAPTFSAGDTPLHISGSDVNAAFNLDQRKRGLLWYATYAVDFSGVYRVPNETDTPLDVTMDFMFPSPDGVYDGFSVDVDGDEAPVSYGDGKARATFTIAPGEVASVSTGYRTQGQDEWRYSATSGVAVIEDFSLTMVTDFDEIDFPTDTVSPTSKERTSNGWELSWDYDSLVSGRQIGLTMPVPLNPGPVASRISFFAPVSLVFYFAALVLLMATRRTNIHPMNFAFLAAGFFAFHLLFAYLVDRVDIYATFAIASVVSVVMCVSYLAMAVRDRRVVLEAAIAQLVFLVLFSFSFFFEGFTGLAITIGAVLTLAYFMFRTARIDWNEVFQRGGEERERRRRERYGMDPGFVSRTAQATAGTATPPPPPPASS